MFRVILVSIIAVWLCACSDDNKTPAPLTIAENTFEAKFNDTLQKHKAFAINASMIAGKKQYIYALADNGAELKIVFSGFEPQKNATYGAHFQNKPKGANVELYFYKPDSTTYYCHGDTGNANIEIVDASPQLLQCRLSANAVNIKNKKDVLKIREGQLNASLTNGVPMGILQMQVKNTLLEFNAVGSNFGVGNVITAKSYDFRESLNLRFVPSTIVTTREYIFAQPSGNMPFITYSPAGNTIIYTAGQESVDGLGRGSIVFSMVDEKKMMGTFHCWAIYNDKDSVELSNGKFFIKF
jgi:hypothetical protein